MTFAPGLIFIALPILDIVTLIKAGDLWGVWPTLGLAIAAGLLGVMIVRHQGLSIGRQVQQSLKAGRLPVIEAFDGACVLAAGTLLLFPGLASDALAMLLLLPLVRALLRRAIAWRLRRSSHRFPPSFATRSSPTSGAEGAVIEGEFEPVEPRPVGDEARHLPPPFRKRPATDEP